MRPGREIALVRRIPSPAGGVEQREAEVYPTQVLRVRGGCTPAGKFDPKAVQRVVSRWFSLKLLREEGGFVFALAAMWFSVVVLLFVAAVDFGVLSVARARLQAAGDAAALAGVQEAEVAAYWDGSELSVRVSLEPDKARMEAEQVLDRNAALWRSSDSLRFRNGPRVDLDAVVRESDTEVRYRIDRVSMEVMTFFLGPVLGRSPWIPVRAVQEAQYRLVGP